MNVFKLPVHPAADVFPMLSDEELDELTADIKANGLLHPLVVNDGHLVDGRNRREACRRAGIEPQVVDLNGLDPVRYIVSANINRRNLTKGQRAMALARLYPEPEKGGRGKTNSLLSKEFSGARISQARTVLAWSPQVAAAVLAGTKSLNDAYGEALKAREDLDSEATRRTRLRDRAPDLADLVDSERMTLIEAEAAYSGRLEEARRQRQACLEILKGLEEMLDVFGTKKRRAHLIEHLAKSEDKTRATTLLRAWVKNLSDTLEELR